MRDIVVNKKKLALDNVSGQVTVSLPSTLNQMLTVSNKNTGWNYPFCNSVLTDCLNPLNSFSTCSN
ncbi:hypothetical protein CLW00_11925 [Mongoliibacter ruber]|uniref:Uncharacterized protein n=1 Tax=Mongoliibacter ruber TaxID=1750599 RepID=A0A2T0WDG1_9BACT|nr:hypothetical protein CLW00_11925 [Mongoliibacter ruber]